MKIFSYFCCVFLGCHLLFCDSLCQDEECYSLESIVKKNPEMSHQILDDHIANIKAKAKSALVRIFGENDVDIPIVNDDSGAAVKGKRKGFLKNKFKGEGNSAKNKKNVNNIKRMTRRDHCECSGFFIGPDGYIITNYTLLKNFSRFYTEMTVKEKNKDVSKRVKLDIVGYSEFYDIVLLKGDIKSSDYILLGDYGDFKVFRYVYSICGDDYKFSTCTDVELKNTLKKGNIKNNVTKVNCYSGSYDHLKPCILIDINGFFIGMRVNCGKFVNNNVCGYGSVIAFSDLRESINEIKTKKYTSFKYDCFNLVSVDDRFKNIKRLQLSYGCYVDAIKCKFANFDLRVGDVIIGVNGTAVNDIESFDRLFNYVKNKDIVFRVNRGSKNIDVKVVSGILSDVKYEFSRNKLNVNGALLVDLNDSHLNLLKSRKSPNISGGVLVSDVNDSNVWKCGSNFVITTVYGKYNVGSVVDIVNIFKNINNYVVRSSVNKKIPFIISGFYLDNPTKEGSFVLDI